MEWFMTGNGHETKMYIGFACEFLQLLFGGRSIESKFPLIHVRQLFKMILISISALTHHSSIVYATSLPTDCEYRNVHFPGTILTGDFQPFRGSSAGKSSVVSVVQAAQLIVLAVESCTRSTG